MYISAVILSFNSAATIGRCLEDLCSALGKVGKKSEIFVVDNGSTDNSLAIIRDFESRFPELVRSIQFDNNTGTTFSRNAALRRATGEFILILDSDAYVNAKAIRTLAEHLSECRDTGIAAPRLSYGNGKFQLSCDVFPTLFRKLQRAMFLKKMEDGRTELRLASSPIEVDYAISACWMISREAFESVGLLDEQIFYSPEDADYCLRTWEAGYKVTYVPAADVVHDAQELSRGLRLSRFHFSHLGGLLYFFRKHRYFFGRARLYRRISRYSR